MYSIIIIFYTTCAYGANERKRHVYSNASLHFSTFGTKTVVGNVQSKLLGKDNDRVRQSSERTRTHKHTIMRRVFHCKQERMVARLFKYNNYSVNLFSVNSEWLEIH